jgi:photosystem II stability/assembly factor-like uncharacterized protein
VAAETTLLIGTRKGLVIARSRDDRRTWELDELRYSTGEVAAVGVDQRRDPPRVFAAVQSMHWGATLVHSDDLGRTWSEPEQPPVAFPQHTGAALIRIWQITPAPADQPDVVYAGVEPHALFRSEDGGVTYSLVEGLWNHPHRTEWRPGAGGACLHTVIPHPTDAQRMLVAMSTGGVYRTADGGATWEPANRGIQVLFAPEDQRFPEYGQCVHHVAMHPSAPDRLFAQNHFGVYRSDNGGDTWEAIENGLPSNFGFPVEVHPHRPQTAYIFPLAADMNRMPADGRCRVYRTDDAGDTWQPLDAGLPDGAYYSAVLRNAMCTDVADSAGIYFGTRVGEVFASRDDGDSWTRVAQHLPDVLSVRVAMS